MPPEKIAQQIEAWTLAATHAVVVEEGEVIFDLSTARFSLTTDHGKCVLHLWSEERNIVRRVLRCEQKAGALRLSVQRLGRAKPTLLELCSGRDRRTPTAKRAARAAFLRMLQRVLTRNLTDYQLESVTMAADLEHSFGPAHVRGVLRRGQSAFAVVAAAAAEDLATLDATLTTALLWLAACRERESRGLVEGVKLILPRGCSATVRARVAHLNHAAAKFHVYELDEQEESLREFDANDAGNIETRMVPLTDTASSESRFAAAIAQVRGIVPGCELAAHSPTVLGFRWKGLEFARAQSSLKSGDFTQQQEIVFGAGAYETVLNNESQPQFAALMQRVMASRSAQGNHNDALYRMQPERWLESAVLADVGKLDHRFDRRYAYSQVPAFAAHDRGMIDVLTCTHEGRLAVIELKAEDDLHMPLQGLDYWSRVRWHHQRNEFQRYGYFSGRELSPEPPLLIFVAPALRIHPATDTLLRMLSHEIEWQVVAVDEDWRRELKVVFRKTATRSAAGGR